MKKPLVSLATALALAACTEEKTCPSGETVCADACISLGNDPANCGACGAACAPDHRCNAGTCEPCLEGACRTAAYVACFATDDVRPVDPWLRPGAARRAGDGPIALAVSGARLHAANSISHSLSSFPLDLSGSSEALLSGSDFEGLAEHGGRLFVSNAGPGTFVAWDPIAERVVDEVALGDLSGVNPRGAAFVGDRAYVALYGTNAASGGQEVVAVDFSGLAACSTPPCGTVVNRISLLSSADAGGLPFPSAVLTIGTKVYVTLANLKLGNLGYYTDPAGNGKLAVIDSAANDALSVVDLGAGCTNPGALAEDAGVLWVSCGGTGALVPLDLSVPLAAGTSVSFASEGVYAPGKLAFCGGAGYVTDQWSGTVVKFDPLGQTAPVSSTVCPNSIAGWAWAADVACAP